MTRRRRLTDDAVAKLKPKAKRYSVPDPELIGHYVRVMPSGVKSYVAVAREPHGKHKQVWTTIGTTDHVKIEDARTKAREIIARVKAGKRATEPPPPPADSFAAVSENWKRRHVEANKLRSRYEIERCLSKYVMPHWHNRPFVEIKRSDVAKLLDHIEDEHGARQANAVLTVIRSIANWFGTRSDDYVAPIARNMKRGTNRPRERILDDEEIRTFWKVAEEAGAFGALLQLALLTAQRKAKLLHMRWSDVPDGVWSVPSEKREKGASRWCCPSWPAPSCIASGSPASTAPMSYSRPPTALGRCPPRTGCSRFGPRCRRTSRRSRSTIYAAHGARWRARPVSIQNMPSV